MDRIRRLRSPFKTKTRNDSTQSDFGTDLSTSPPTKETIESTSSGGGTSSRSTNIVKKFNRTGSMDEHHSLVDKETYQSLLTTTSSPSLLHNSPFKKLNALRSPKKNQLNFLDLSTNSSNSSGQGVKLSAHQREIVREAWHLANKKKGNAGTWIFKWLFLNYPFLKETFDLDGVSDDKLDDNPRFQQHAQVFTDVIEMVVDSMDALDDSLGPLIISYGSKHVLFEKRHGFKPEYWNFFAGAMCEYASQSWKSTLHINNETLHAWRLLVYFLVSKVKEGYYLEKERLAELEVIQKMELI